MTHHLPNESPDGDGDAVDARRDPLRTLWYVMTPTLYTDEDSSTQELLWQQVLELRAVRATIVVALAALLLAALAALAVLVVAQVVTT